MSDINVNSAFSAIAGSYGGEQYRDASDAYQVRMKVHGAFRIFGLPDSNGNPSVGWDQVVELTTKSFTVPKRAQSRISIPYMNGYTSFLGKPEEVEDFDWTGNSVVGRDVYKRLNMWANQGFNQATKTIGRASQYRKNGYMVKFGPDFDPAHNEVWELRSLLLVELKSDDVDMEAESDNVEITATLHADECIYRGMNWDGSDAAFNI